MEKIIVLGAGDELREHRRAVFREREFFDEADFVFGEAERSADDEREEDRLRKPTRGLILSASVRGRGRVGSAEREPTH